MQRVGKKNKLYVKSRGMIFCRFQSHGDGMITHKYSKRQLILRMSVLMKWLRDTSAIGLNYDSNLVYTKLSLGSSIVQSVKL